ncbi:MAG TPA: hypothetical protein VF039_08675 [Longimicrobiales bacterium]
MDERIHIVVRREEKQRFRRMAERQGQTLSEWLRDAAREKLEAAEANAGLGSAQALHSFFAALDEAGVEPDWSEQRALIERSKGRGAAET